MERPREINRFAALAVAACLLNGASTLIVFHFAQKGWLGSGLGAAITIGLILWVVLARGLISRVVITIWLAFGIGAGLTAYALMLHAHRLGAMSPMIHAMSLATILLNAVALFFLWKRASTAWLQTRAS